MIISKKAVCVSMALFIIAMMAAQVSARDALFFGLMDAAGKPVQPEMEQVIRNALAAGSGWNLINPLETQRINRERERQGRSGMELFVPPSAKLPDSTIIIRGAVEELSMNIRRRLFFWGGIDAQITVKFYFCDLAGGSAYQGEFSAAASKKKDFVFFSSPQKVIHISAIDRSELLGEMQKTIVKDIAKFASTYFSSLAADTEKQKDESPESTVLQDGDTAGVTEPAE